MEQQDIVYALLGIIAFGFFWRWIDSVGKKIDKLNDKIDGIFEKAAMRSDVKELKDEQVRMWSEIDSEKKRLSTIEGKVNNCKSCNH